MAYDAQILIRPFARAFKSHATLQAAIQWRKALQIERRYLRQMGGAPLDLSHKTRRINYMTHLYSGWCQDLAQRAGCGPGVYIARLDHAVLYVGKASALANRLTDHHRKWMSCNAAMFPTHFDVIDVAKIEDAIQIEAELIRSLRPPLNRRHETGTPPGLGKQVRNSAQA